MAGIHQDQRQQQDFEDNIKDCDNENENGKFVSEPESIRKLFIGGIHYQTTTDSLKAYFEQYGTVVDAVVMMDRNMNRSRGFGFITYSHSFMVDKAQAARPHKVDDRSVETKRAVPRLEIARSDDAATSTKRVFVSGLKDKHDDEDLYHYFSKFGDVKFVKIIYDRESGRKRGFAFVEYNDYDPVDKVILLTDHTIKGNRVEVKKALDRVNSKRNGGGGSSDAVATFGSGNQGMNDYQTGRVTNNDWGNIRNVIGNNQNVVGNNQNGIGYRWFAGGSGNFMLGGGLEGVVNPEGVVRSSGEGSGNNTGCGGGIQQGGVGDHHEIGLGYQQNYGAGPVRGNFGGNNNPTRMNPYRRNYFQGDYGDGNQSSDTNCQIFGFGNFGCF